jgi:hypothetical protein
VSLGNVARYGVAHPAGTHDGMRMTVLVVAAIEALTKVARTQVAARISVEAPPYAEPRFADPTRARIRARARKAIGRGASAPTLEAFEPDTAAR